VTYLDHINICNNFASTGYRPFLIDGARSGWVRDSFAERLKDWSDYFLVDKSVVSLHSRLKDFNSRSEAVKEPLRELTKENYIEAWRDEMYPVTADWHTPPSMQIERAACPYFGIRAYGVHMNGFVRKPDGIYMWVARRDRTKKTYPGLLDNMVAGGQPIGLGLLENLAKESKEEAGIPPDLAYQATPVSLISYTHRMPNRPEGGVKPDQMFCYDLEVPEDFEPIPVDGEVESFQLMPIRDVAKIVRDSFDFKFNCNLVIIDFLIRHGIISPDNDSDYAALVHGLRSGK